ncbi:4a-hydroxytetrahydrobiopterin dehydratase [Pelodictyon luteolum]|uniref:Putative pterin-4-alpha-carbinolamine dehydratase n=1 Tax=Chlorobium luteolum (strain DSM 273 / BCRC 81028 / 2530) TaxID=319225 RepID=PHS_CHLL3|nr:4a-hydroxytetrahydrobiopterin dehydratase [Pelodictyon luteolum]Q3B6N5.2 RecName: Full=Putative pterin-4-alpha-carbinolamine dehydratase; Short=PHS; AltName: Full=4-alpha-hydroxy-tetrahydropterin dehydratase; AltName: Full=Pterin carbinolamine dehydratase; Short=PCD [Pelodictyon luteolum DSM 273]
MGELNKTKCVSCSEGLPPLAERESEELLKEIPEWVIVSEDGVSRLVRTFTFENFREAMAFAGSVGELAESEQHHPKLVTEWGKVRVEWWTHAVHGLHMNDFVMAARTDELFQEL